MPWVRVVPDATDDIPTSLQLLCQLEPVIDASGFIHGIRLRGRFRDSAEQQEAWQRWLAEREDAIRLDR